MNRLDFELRSVEIVTEREDGKFENFKLYMTPEEVDKLVDNIELIQDLSEDVS